MENQCEFVCSRGIAKSCKYRDPDLRSSDRELRFVVDHPKKVYGFIKSFPPSIYVCTDALTSFVRNMLPTLHSPFILVTGDSDLIVPNQCIDAATTILGNPNLVKWFAQNCFGGHPKLHQIPIGLNYHTLTYKTPHPWGSPKLPIEQEAELKSLIKVAPKIEDRHLKCYGNFHFNWYASPDREEARNTIRLEVIDYQEKQISRLETWKAMSNYAFVPSPKGVGPDCHRTWEALSLGCIPIVKTSPLDSLFAGLPVWIINDWTEITYETMEQTRKHFIDNPPTYEKLQLKTWIHMIKDIQ